MSKHTYSSDFYDYIDNGSRTSARAVAPMLLKEMQIDSLLDVGAGHGAWAAEWLAAGVSDVVAVDGDYVARDRLAVPEDCFISHDLTRPLDLGRRFDLVQSLEVAEHLPAESAGDFVTSLARHGDVILFSAAVPHQGGEHHCNEQPPEYWRDLFSALGFDCFNWIRPRLASRRDVKAWYRYNTLVYANAAGQDRISPSMLETRVAKDLPLAIGGDLAWAARRTLVRLMPTALVKPVAMAKASMEARFLGQAQRDH